MEKLMDLDIYFTFNKLMVCISDCKRKGVDLLSDDLAKDFTLAWNEDGKQEKVGGTWPVYMRIGKDGNQ